MAMRDRYVLELAATVNKMFGDGKRDPSAEEIADKHFPRRALGNEITAGIRKRLRRIRDVLVSPDYGRPVYLVSGYYYSQYRGTLPLIEAEARRCIPGGYHADAAGICLNLNGDKDLIWQATINAGMVSGAAKLKASIDRTLSAVAENRVSMPTAAVLMDRGHRRAIPSDPALAAQIMRELPETAGMAEVSDPPAVE